MDASPLDFVAQACMDLSEALSDVPEYGVEREILINNHIKKVWSTVTPVDDFKRNLEWVNVSEPLSLAFHCVDKIVVLDFWTYCCINCYHVLPDLAHLEKLHKVEDGLVVIGVHCAKFLNEKDSSNVLAAVQRYGIHHPVLNDPEGHTWNDLGVHCWPTLVILGPGNKPLFVLVGEGHREELVWYVGAALKHFGSRISTAQLPISISNHLNSETDQVLKFPGKIAVNPFYRGRPLEPFLAVSDTGHHRVLLADCSGLVVKVIGGPKPGLRDGKMSQAQFNSPQGLCWMSSSVLAVCDTGNHMIRALHLDEEDVAVLTGTGSQGAAGDLGGNCLGLQPLSSPWDVGLFFTPDMDMSVRPPPPPPPLLCDGLATANDNKASVKEEHEKEKDVKRRVLLIACAGSHQIWALFLDTTIWWKYKTYSEGTCSCVAGSGAEAARNSSYPTSAAFAQPSGLALKQSGTPEMFIADSESSSIRRLMLTTGQVFTLCGGDRNPLNLFAFGDTDETGLNAKFQHPMAVAYCETSKSLFVADTYNHKLKKVDLTSQKVTTLLPNLIETNVPAKFNEPSGLSVSNDGKYLYIADTNNHRIVIYNITKNVCQDFPLRLPEPKFVEPDHLILYKNDLFVNKKCGSLIIHFNVSLDSNPETKNVKFTSGAPQHWTMCIRDEHNKDVTTEDFEFNGCAYQGTKLPGRVEMKLKQRSDKTHYLIYLGFKTSLCEGSVCFSHSFMIRSTILVRDSVKMTESYKITCKVNPINRSQEKHKDS